MSLLNYIAILGRQPELGLVELESLAGADGVEPLGRQAALFEGELDVGRLGGVVKLGRIIYDGAVVALTELMDVLPASEGKTTFGISFYGGIASREVLARGLELKKALRARGPVRLVAPGAGTALSAAEVRHNGLIGRGFELLVVRAGQRMVVAQTIDVQDIDWYSKRDYDRPARSAKVGMLPPKLAQVLVNAAGGDGASAGGGPGVIVDPFCGTGVVLQEALLMGRVAVGSDLAAEMVAASQTNLRWLAEVAPTPLPHWQVEQADARSVQLPVGCVVVSEGYLGPNLTHSPTLTEVTKMRVELLALYRDCLRNWGRQLARGAEVSLCVPAWRAAGQWQYLGLVDELADLGYTLKSFAHARTPLLYARGDQVVGRQLLLLRKL